MELYEYNAYQLSDMLSQKKISSVELTQSILKRIGSVDSKLNAFVCFDEEFALNQAENVDKKRAKGEPCSLLAGIPIGLKDNICTKDFKTTCCSKMLENYTSPYDAAVVQKLRKADSVIIGKLNMDEFAMGSSTENSCFGATANPFDVTRVSGGSSGGCASAVSSGEIIAALGSDTGGSIRQPASFCGAVGLKPTYGTVSRYGLVAFASSLDQIGPVCRCVKDTAMMYSVIAGYDVRDATSVRKQYTDFYKDLNSSVKGLKIGVPTGLFEKITQPDVLKSFYAAISLLEKCGAQVKRIKIDNTEFALPAYYVISSAEASSNLSRFDGVRYGFRAENYTDLSDMYIETRTEGFGDECKRRILLGTFVLSAGYYDACYKKALYAAKLITQSVKQQFGQIDIIALPTAPETAFEIGKKADDPVEMYKSDVFTVLANLTGIPAISVPCGTDDKGLPVGIQFMADSFYEQTLLDTAFAYERAACLNIRPSI